MIRKSIKRHCFASSLLSLIYLLATPCMLAQGSAFTYQGKLTDSGNPANGNYGFQFKLFDTVAIGTGTQQGSTFTVAAVLVTAGAFTVQLDFGSSVFPGTARFLEIAVKPTSGSTFTTLGPRQPVSSSPYSIHALNADGLSVACAGCVTSSQIQSIQGSQITGSIPGSQISGAIPVASVPAGSTSYVQNRTSQQAATNFNVSGNGTIGGKLTVGNVGIGTTNPVRPLEIATGKMRFSDPQGDIEFTEVADLIAHATEAVPVALDPAFRVDVGANLTRVFTVLNNGNVGIGTAFPPTKLYVDGGNSRAIIGSGGVRGESSTGSAAAVEGLSFGTSPGVLGSSGTYGVSGSANGEGVGVKGSSLNGVGVRAESFSGDLMDGFDGLLSRKFHITNAGTYVGGSDFAEALPAHGEKASYEPGDVLVVSTEASATVEKASRPYDARLVGVYSTRPGMLGADKNGTSRVDENELPVAIVGIVPTKVSTENGPIEAGDLLTTSATPGYAMKASPVRVGRVKVYRTGTILGKALEPLKEGKGVIKVLVTLR